MAYVQRALVFSNPLVKTFNANNIWLDTGYSKDSLLDQNFIDKGFDPANLNKSLTNIYVNFIDNGPLGTDGGELWLSEDIDKNLGVTAMELVDSDVTPRLLLTIPAYLPKDSLLASDLILFYTDDPLYVPSISSFIRSNPIRFSASTTHNDAIVMTADVTYIYNKPIKYRVKVSNASGTVYTSSWSAEVLPYYPINYNILTSNLAVGSNDITLEVQDAADATKFTSQTITNAITLTDSAPTIAIINADSNNFKIHATITDTENDIIQYQLTLINSLGINVIQPWTTLQAPPADIQYTFDSNTLAIGESNVLRIEAKDNFGQISTAEYSFMGEYKNILFRDEQGNYYTTDKGSLLQLLHFGTIISGRVTIPKTVIVENNNEFPVTDLRLSVANNQTVEGVTVELSKTNNPFTPIAVLDYGDQVLNYNDTVTFYVRINPLESASGLDNFEIDANAEAVLS